MTDEQVGLPPDCDLNGQDVNNEPEEDEEEYCWGNDPDAQNDYHDDLRSLNE